MTYKYTACIKMLCVWCNENMPVKNRSASISDVPKKLFLPTRPLVLPQVSDSDKCKALSI